jgi:hypothetical protein
MTAMDEGSANPQGPTGEGPGPKSSPSTPEPAPPPDLLLVTIQAKTGQIVKVESADVAGIRHELTNEKKADLGKETAKVTLEALLEQAFEAGIASVLDDGGQNGARESETEAEESEEEAELRHLLLGPLIRHSPAKRLMQHEVLSRAILGTVVREAIDPGSLSLESHPAQQQPRKRAGKARQHMQPPG